MARRSIARGDSCTVKGTNLGQRRTANYPYRSDDREYGVLTDGYEGQRYNSPNDIETWPRPNLFTDPWHGDRSQMMEMSIEGVYRIDLDGRVVRILEQPAIERPNGVAVTQDGKTLYVIDSCPTVGGNRKVWRFSLDEAGNAHD
ncbi:MAG: SMP-30/gluconolactonase/LRE family protein [Planctomycetota bacterium]